MPTRAAGETITANARFDNGTDLIGAAEQSVPDLFGEDWSRVAGVFECLGSSARLALIASLLSGPRSRGELLQALGDTTSTTMCATSPPAGLLETRRRAVRSTAAD